MSVFSIIVQDDREQAIEAAAQHIYEEKGDRAGISYIGWHAEPEGVQEEWLTDVRATIDAYEAARQASPAVPSDKASIALLEALRPFAEMASLFPASDDSREVEHDRDGDHGTIALFTVGDLRRAACAVHVHAGSSACATGDLP